MHLRQYEIVQDADKLKVDIQATCMKYKTIKQWAYILHDKDDTRPHYHIYLNFGTSIDSKLVAEWFQLGYTDKNGKEQTGEQFIVGENTQTAAVETAREFFDNPIYLDELSEFEAEASGLDEY